MSRTRKNLLLLLSCAATLGLSGCGDRAAETDPEQAPEASVAFAVRVNATTLTERELDEMVNRELFSYPKTPGRSRNALRASVRERLVQSFVEQQALLDRAAAEGIEVTDADLDTALALVRERLPDTEAYAEQLARRGLTETEYRNALRENPQMRISRLIERHVKPAPMSILAIERAYAAHISRFVEAPRVRSRQILQVCAPEADPTTVDAKRARAGEARARLVRGEAFAQVAKTASEGPSAPFGGDLGELQAGQMAEIFGEVFEAAALSQQVHALGPVFRSEVGFHVLQVTARTVASTNALSDVRAEVEALAERDAQDAAYRRYVDGVIAESEVVYGRLGR